MGRTRSLDRLKTREEYPDNVRNLFPHVPQTEDFDMGKSHKYSSGERENKASEKGEAHERRQSGSGTIRSEEHVGTHHGHAGNKGDGIRFKVPEHPDKSVMHTPEK